VPRYRYTETTNIAWAEGHANSVEKGGLNWCRDMYIGYSIGGEDWNWMLSPGGVCAAYVT
jgi:hypothetical protein